MPLTQENRSLVLTLIEGARKTFANAEALYAEASCLANEQRWARGLLLHQISLEECAKIEILGAAVTSVLLGHVVDVDRLYAAMRRHDSKNKTNAYFLPKSESELAASAAGDLGAAVKAFNERQREFHTTSNVAKNAALYVDPGDPFSSPLERFTEDDFVRVRTFNDQLLAVGFAKSQMLSRWAEDLDAAQRSVHVLLGAVGFQDLDRNDPESLRKVAATLEENLKAFAARK